MTRPASLRIHPAHRIVTNHVPVLFDITSYATHTQIVIKSFADKRTASLFTTARLNWIAEALRVRAKEKLKQLEAAERLEDLRVPPSNHLEALRGKRKGQYSIRVNNQWRICFRWDGGDAHEVEFTDYH